MEPEVVLEMSDICKEYFGNPVLKNVNLRVRAGEIVALVGENGAGKSTLMNILFGMPVIHTTGGFQGEVKICGKKAEIHSPFEAMEYGVGMVHQEFMLIGGYDVSENIKLNRENLKQGPLSKLPFLRLGTLDRKAMAKDTMDILDELGIDLLPSQKVGDLPVGYKQFIEIARELDKKNIRLIVLDEPTAVLTEKEANQFLECVRRVAERGVAFIFISHRLDEIKQYSHHIYVLRDGEPAGDFDTADVSVVEISEKMIGQKVELLRRDRKKAGDHGNAVEIRNFSVNMPGEELHGIDLCVKKGEILGIGGLAGHGKAAIANGIMGLYPSAGEVMMYGQPLRVEDTLSTLEKGVMFVSEDRRGVGLLLDESIETNVTVAAMRVHNDFTRKIGFVRFYDQKAAKAYTDEMIRKLDIRCTGSNQFAGRLSGGNQQKVCIARAMSMRPDILFVSEPTRGIDIGAKKRILDALVQMNEETGMTIVITSSELAELRSVCDRIAIVTEGRIAGVLDPLAEDYKFGLLMSGSKAAGEEADLC